MNKVEKNQKVGISYSLKDTNGRVIEEVPPTHPIIYLHGYDNIVPGLEKALEGRQVGERFTVSVSYEEGYGPYQQELVMEVSKEELRDIGEIWVGMEVEMFQDNPEESGFHIPEDPADFYKDEPTSDDPSLFVVREILDKAVLLDGNHPLAGMDLIFDVAIVSIETASVTEIEMGYPDEPEEPEDRDDRGEAPDAGYGRRWR